MLKRILGRLTYANVMATTAVFIAIGGGAYAAGLAKNSVKSKQIKNGAVKTADLGKNAVTSKKVGAGTLLASDFASGQLPAGPRGPAGADGADGADGTDGVNGVDGEDGTDGIDGTNGVDGTDGTNGVDGTDGVDGEDGSPDTPAQVLAKLLTVDGPGSALSADNLDGQDSTAFGDVQSSQLTVPLGAGTTNYAPITGVSQTFTQRAAAETGTPDSPLELRDLFVRLTTAAGGTTTFTVGTAGGTAAISCSIPAGATTCSSSAGNATVPAGSALATTVVEGTGANADDVTATVGFRMTPG